ncbi:MAG: rod shape-determining protein RodA [Acidimicrobiales bacterium]
MSGPRDPVRHLDFTLIGAILAISSLGVLMVYSSTRQRQITAGEDPGFYLKRQLLFVALGLVVMVVSVLWDYEILREVAPGLYLGAVTSLALVLSPLGSESRGIQAWFQIGSFQLQPSELAKVALTVALAAFCSAHRGRLEGKPLLLVLGLVAIPLGLVYAQPDLGTAMVLSAIVFGVLVVGGTQGRHLLAMVGLVLVAAVAVLQLGVLKDYQVDRLTAFLDPESDSQGTAYNLQQSQVAIAAGGFLGRGLFQGTQTNLSFVPEQHTDFIFTAVGEELGFIGSATLLGLFGLVIWRVWRTASLARDQFGSLLCVGVLAMLVFQVFENIGMTMGMTPVAGIPLPLMSYGGSSTLATFLGMGLVLNVHMRRLR